MPGGGLHNAGPKNLCASTHGSKPRDGMNRIRQAGRNQPTPTRWVWLNWAPTWRWVAWGLYMVVITRLLTQPADDLPRFPLLFPHQDKVLHVAIFAVMAGALRWALPWTFSKGPAWIGGLALCLAYGLAIEAIQGAVPSAGRSFEWADLVADGCGALLGWWMAAWCFAPDPAPRTED